MSQPIHMKDGYNYSGYNMGGGDASETITYAQWLQLTPEQQANGDYYIPDWSGSIVPIGGFDTTPTEGSINPVTSNGIHEAIETVKETTMLYKVVLSSVSSLSSCRFPASGTNDKIKSTMEVTESVLSNPAAQTGDWSVNFYDGYLTVTGNISGTTDITLKFQDCITLS